MVSQYARQRQSDFPGLILWVPAFGVHYSRLRPPDGATLIRTGQILIDSYENLSASSRSDGFIAAKTADERVVHAASLPFLLRLGSWGFSWHWHGPKLRMPLLMQLAEKDRAICNVAAQRVFAAAPASDKQLVVWPQARHTIFWDPVAPQTVDFTVNWMRQRATSRTS